MRKSLTASGVSLCTVEKINITVPQLLRASRLGMYIRVRVYLEISRSCVTYSTMLSVAGAAIISL